MRAAFKRRLDEGVLLFDGAMGTTLYDRGVHLGRCFDALNLDDPDLVQGVHADYLRAGAQVLQTNTFGANVFKLGRHHLADSMADINRRGAALAKEIAAGRPGVMAAGSMGPLGVKLEPWGPTSREEARAAFASQAAALVDGGVDLFVLETFADFELPELPVATVTTPDSTVVPVLTPFEEALALIISLAAPNSNTVPADYNIIALPEVRATLSGPISNLAVQMPFVTIAEVPAGGSVVAGTTVDASGRVTITAPIDSATFRITRLEPVVTVNRFKLVFLE